MSSDVESGDEATGMGYTTSLSSVHSSPPIIVPPLTHDTTRSRYHMKDLAAFAASLENAASRAFPNRGKSSSRYTKVEVLLLSWEEDDLFVETERNDLEDVFKSYGFDTEYWPIPTENSHLELMIKAASFVKLHESLDTLIIVYYGGHATMNAARQSSWSCKRDLEYASLEWSAIQTLFEKSRSDALFLLDCCAAASAAPLGGRAITETIAACGWESIAAEPGQFSFTDTLIKVLQDWIHRPFTVAMLHSEILSRLKHEKPVVVGKRRVEWRRTPVYIVTTKDVNASSIQLSRLLPIPQALPAITQLQSNAPSTPMATHTRHFSDELRDLTSTSPAGTLHTPHVLISLALEENQLLDADACSQWLASFPALVKYAKVQSVFWSHSMLLLVSLPVTIWNMLEDHQACVFIGFIRSRDMLTRPDVSSSNSTPKTAEAGLPHEDALGNQVSDWSNKDYAHDLRHSLNTQSPMSSKSSWDRTGTTLPKSRVKASSKGKQVTLPERNQQRLKDLHRSSSVPSYNQTRTRPHHFEGSSAAVDKSVFKDTLVSSLSGLSSSTYSAHSDSERDEAVWGSLPRSTSKNTAFDESPLSSPGTTPIPTSPERTPADFASFTRRKKGLDSLGDFVDSKRSTGKQTDRLSDLDE